MRVMETPHQSQKDSVFILAVILSTTFTISLPLVKKNNKGLILTVKKKP